ncbi:hypothetical protein RFI_15797 [Reticulomyxa filosa]|uniref:Uncharacterized protein n=1 Tax=Reticulomyxa filosa TaxID=46433 RepID=X6N7Z0_RETFI|nr:hypothetical protein RFI_15797 [Reticulomyxa filosa]|eukprot:ETO21407.1 hypothetical protein RFI_15797 [Reticulomyxa filosa]
MSTTSNNLKTKDPWMSSIHTYTSNGIATGNGGNGGTGSGNANGMVGGGMTSSNGIINGSCNANGSGNGNNNVNGGNNANANINILSNEKNSNIHADALLQLHYINTYAFTYIYIFYLVCDPLFVQKKTKQNTYTYAYTHTHIQFQRQECAKLQREKDELRSQTAAIQEQLQALSAQLQQKNEEMQQVKMMSHNLAQNLAAEKTERRKESEALLDQLQIHKLKQQQIETGLRKLGVDSVAMEGASMMVEQTHNQIMLLRVWLYQTNNQSKNCPYSTKKMLQTCNIC